MWIGFLNSFINFFFHPRCWFFWMPQHLSAYDTNVVNVWCLPSWGFLILLSKLFLVIFYRKFTIMRWLLQLVFLLLCTSTPLSPILLLHSSSSTNLIHLHIQFPQARPPCKSCVHWNPLLPPCTPILSILFSHTYFLQLVHPHLASQFFASFSQYVTTAV